MNQLMRRISVLLLAIIIGVLAAGCGNDRSDKTAASEIVTTQESTEVNQKAADAGEGQQAPEEKDTDAYTESGDVNTVSSFHGLGNDPNNIYNGMYTLAFDDEHMFFLSNGVLMQVSFDGSEAKAIFNGSKPQFINSWDGDLYYLFTSKTDLFLRKLSLQDYVSSDVYKMSGDYDAHSLLVVDGIAVFGYDSSITGVTAVDLVTGQEHDLLSAGGFEKPYITVSEDTVYAFVSNSQYKIALWSVPRSELMTGEMKQVTKPRDFGIYKTMIFTPDGIHRIKQPSSNPQRSYQEWLYADIEDDGDWPEFRRLSEDESSWSSEAKPFITDKAARYELGGNLFILCRGEVWYYPGYDFSNHVSVAEADVEASDFSLQSSRYGVHDGILYAVEIDDEGRNGTIIKIYSDGASERVPFTVTED